MIAPRSFALSLCFVFLLPYAEGQPTQDIEKLTSIFQEAEGLYQTQQYEEALAKFREVYLLSKEPELLFNIAQCLRLLGRYEEAATGYRNFLKDASGSSLAPNAKARLSEIEVLLSDENRGVVEFSSSLSSVKVFVDGEARGDSPITLRLSPGRHTLRFEKDGFYPREETLTLDPKQSLSSKISLIKEPPGFFVPATIGGTAAIFGAGFLGLFLTSQNRDFESEGITLRTLSTTADVLFLSAGVSALIVWRQQQKAKELIQKERP